MFAGVEASEVSREWCSNTWRWQDCPNADGLNNSDVIMPHFARCNICCIFDAGVTKLCWKSHMQEGRRAKTSFDSFAAKQFGHAWFVPWTFDWGFWGANQSADFAIASQFGSASCWETVKWSGLELNMPYALASTEGMNATQLQPTCRWRVSPDSRKKLGWKQEQP